MGGTELISMLLTLRPCQQHGDLNDTDSIRCKLHYWCFTFSSDFPSTTPKETFAPIVINFPPKVFIDLFIGLSNPTENTSSKPYFMKLDDKSDGNSDGKAVGFILTENPTIMNVIHRIVKPDGKYLVKTIFHEARR
ncbi:hypothetical protein PIB30_089614 [Stylosanthes scabra]|uniref:Uncharacterized protein n=1 Tax=Stylosanthes scabra TaxID=79078 RepID=A0ABU6VSH0_9FABA|nr:hypothetical protein [Stylosanthes scabra]